MLTEAEALEYAAFLEAEGLEAEVVERPGVAPSYFSGGLLLPLSLIHNSEPTRRSDSSYAVY